MFLLIATAPSLAAAVAGLLGHGILQTIWLLDDSYGGVDEIAGADLPKIFSRLIVFSPALLPIGILIWLAVGGSVEDPLLNCSP